MPPDYDRKKYREKVEFLISNKAETATNKVNAFLENIEHDDILSIQPIIVPIGASERKAYLVGAMICYLVLKEEFVQSTTSQELPVV